MFSCFFQKTTVCCQSLPAPKKQLIYQLRQFPALNHLGCVWQKWEAKKASYGGRRTSAQGDFAKQKRDDFSEDGHLPKMMAELKGNKKLSMLRSGQNLQPSSVPLLSFISQHSKAGGRFCRKKTGFAGRLWSLSKIPGVEMVSTSPDQKQSWWNFLENLPGANANERRIIKSARREKRLPRPARWHGALLSASRPAAGPRVFFLIVRYTARAS